MLCHLEDAILFSNEKFLLEYGILEREGVGREREREKAREKGRERERNQGH